MIHIKKFESFEEEKFDLGNYPEEDQEDREEECKPCEDDKIPGGEWSEESTPHEHESHDDAEDDEAKEERRRLWGDEATVERISSFRQFEAKKEAKKPTTKKEKELAAKYPPKDKITKGDFITAAIENKKKGKENKKEDKDEGKKDNKPKFGSKEWREKYAKK